MNKKGIISKIIDKIKNKVNPPKKEFEFVEDDKKDVFSEYYIGKYAKMTDREFLTQREVVDSIFRILASSDEDLDCNKAKFDKLMAQRSLDDMFSERSTKPEEEVSIEGGRQKTLSLRGSQYTIH